MDLTAVEDIDENVVPIRKPRRPGKRLHRAKRVIINDSQNSYLSRSYLLATNYKKKNDTLLENNRKLAKALAESELRCQMMEKQMRETYRDLNYNNVLRMKMNKVTRNLSDMAAILRETVSIMESTLNYTDDVDDTTNEVIQSPKKMLEGGNNSAAGSSGFDLIFSRNNNQFPSQIKPPDMSAIEEVSLSLGELTAKIPFLFENEDEKEPKAASKISDEKIRKGSSGGNVKRSSARRQSSLIRARSKTPSPLKSDGSPFSETPKTPPVQFASSKFKSNIPKPVSFKETKKPETNSPAKASISSDKVKEIQVTSTSDKSLNSKQVIAFKEASSPAKKTLPDSKSKQQSLNSKAKKSNSEGKVKSSAANNKSFVKGAKNSQPERNTAGTEFNEVVIPTEHDDNNLNLRRCTFTVARSSFSGLNEGEKMDPFLSQESLPPPNINRLTIVKSSNKERCGEYFVPKVTSVVISPSAEKCSDKDSNIPTPRSEHSVKEKQDPKDVSSTVGQPEENKNPTPKPPNVTIIASVDMSLTEIIPREIICNAIEQGSVAEPQALEEVSVPALEPLTVIEEQMRSEWAKDCENLGKAFTNKNEQSSKAPEQNKTNEAADVNILSTASSCQKSDIPHDQKLEKGIVSNKVSLNRRNSKKKKQSGNSTTAKKKISCVFSSSDSDDDDVESSRSKLVSLFAVSPAKSLRLAPKQNHFVTLGNSPKVNLGKPVSSSTLASTDKGERNEPPYKASSKSKSVQQTKIDSSVVDDDDDDDFYMNFRLNQKKTHVIDSSVESTESKEDKIEPSNKLTTLDGPATEVEHNANNIKEPNIKIAETNVPMESSKKHRGRKRKTDSNKTEKAAAKPQKSNKGKATVSVEKKDINDENTPLPANREIKEPGKHGSIVPKKINSYDENQVEIPKTKNDKNSEENLPVAVEPGSKQNSAPAVQLNMNSPLQNKKTGSVEEKGMKMKKRRNDENAPLPVDREIKKLRKSKSVASKKTNSRGENQVKIQETKNSKNLEKRLSVTVEPGNKQDSAPAIQLNLKSPLQNMATESNVSEDVEKRNTGSKLSSVWNLRLSSESVRSSTASSERCGRESSRRRKPVSYKEPSLMEKLRREF